MPILEESDLRHDTNEALPELQKREIHALMSKTNREIELIDPETGDLSHIRDKMVERIAVLKAMVSPVKELPNEILAKIFVQYTQDTDPIYKGAMPAPPLVPRSDLFAMAKSCSDNIRDMERLLHLRKRFCFC